jgi:hypothetical protein
VKFKAWEIVFGSRGQKPTKTNKMSTSKGLNPNSFQLHKLTYLYSKEKKRKGKKNPILSGEVF